MIKLYTDYIPSGKLTELWKITMFAIESSLKGPFSKANKTETWSWSWNPHRIVMNSPLAGHASMNSWFVGLVREHLEVWFSLTWKVYGIPYFHQIQRGISQTTMRIMRAINHTMGECLQVTKNSKNMSKMCSYQVFGKFLGEKKTLSVTLQ